MAPADKPLVWLHGAVKTPPFSAEARLEAGLLFRQLQRSDRLGMSHSRPMPSIGRRCHELRIVDEAAVVIGEVFSKKTPATPQHIIDVCRRRFRDYDTAIRDEEH